MNWGKGIMVVMISFVLFIATLVTILIMNRVDLVSEDYYQKEIAFDEEISSVRNWNEIGVDPVFQTNDQHLIIRLPSIKNVSSFQLSFIRPNDNKQDLKFDVAGTNTIVLEKAKFEKGQYEYRLQCSNGQKNYLKKGIYYMK